MSIRPYQPHPTDPAFALITALRQQLAAKEERIATLERENKACYTTINAVERCYEDLRAAIRERVYGWREWDWPEGFDRRTAEIIADSVREALRGG